MCGAAFFWIFVMNQHFLAPPRTFMSGSALFSLFAIVSEIKVAIQQNSLSVGKCIHSHMVKIGIFTEIALSNHLLNLYCKSGQLRDARDLFDEMPERDLVSYTTLISSYSRLGSPEIALDLVSCLHRSAMKPNPYMLSSSVAACLRLKNVSLGEQVHAQAITSSFGLDPYVNSALIDLYSKLGYLDTAVSLFRQSPIDDPVMFNSMVSGYVSSGAFKEALCFFREVRQRYELKPTKFSFVSLVKACSELEKIIGEQLHGLILMMGFESNCFIGTSLIDMYATFGDVESSQKVYESVFSADIALYNAMIGGLLRNGLEEIALKYFNNLRSEGFSSDECTLSSVLKACSTLQSIDLGTTIHGIVEKTRFRLDVVVNSALVDMYMKCGLVENGCKIFGSMNRRNTISYNSLISGFGQNGYHEKALDIFNDMNLMQLDVDLATFVCLLISCPGHEWVVYTHALKHGFGSDVMVRNSLLDSLWRNGACEEALDFFNKMEKRNVVTWTTAISGLTQLGRHSDAAGIFRTMISTGISPNSFTFSSVLKSCGNLAGLVQGRCIHACSIKHGALDEYTTSSLLDMYAKCGSLDECRRIFNEVKSKDIVLWNTMLTGYAQHGYGCEALELFAMMERHETNPNHVTFVSLLTACSRSGLVQKGVELFNSMTSKYDILPNMEHYACMVDLFGRAGMLDRAKALISGMPFEADLSVWTVLLAACKLHGNLELAKLAREHVRELEGETVPTVVLMSNMYYEIGNQQDAANLREGLGGEAIKNPGFSWLHITEQPS